MMDKSFLITTGNQHQYVYSDALCYFLYVPEEMATVMEHMDDPLAELSQCILDSSNGSIINVI